MRLWIREIAGWLLLLIGLLLFYASVNLYLRQPGDKIVSAGGLTVIGLILFRGGIHLLKVATAAQVCLQARRDASRDPARDRFPASRG